MDALRKKLTPEDYASSAWSGGLTRQIAIFPEDAGYAARDFLWRISSAEVALEESDFTHLPDYDRLIAPLKGAMILTHGGGAPVRLTPFQVHAFDGGAATHSRGRCTDFNLMLRKGAADGTMEAVRLPECAGPWQPDFRAEEVLVFCGEGCCAVSEPTGRTELAAGEALRLGGAGVGSLTLSGEGTLVICQMWRN